MTRDPKAQPERSTFGVRSLGHDPATRIGVRLVRRWGTGTTSRPPRSGPTTTSPHRSTPTTATATRSARNAGRSATSTGGRHSPVGASVPGASVPRTSRAAREVQAGPGGWESSRESAVSPRVTACAAAPLRKLSPRICRRSTGRESGSGSVLAPGAGRHGRDIDCENGARGRTPFRGWPPSPASRLRPRPAAMGNEVVGRT